MADPTPITTTVFANRYGVDLTFTGDSETLTVDFANSVSLDITGDVTWATGGKMKSKKVPFRNPLSGTLTITTQMMCQELINMVAGGALSDTQAVFKDDDTLETKYYAITGTTTWKDEDGSVHTETFSAPKACARTDYKPSYTGDGDPQSVTITFDLLPDDTSKKVFSTGIATGNSAG